MLLVCGHNILFAAVAKIERTAKPVMKWLVVAESSMAKGAIGADDNSVNEFADRPLVNLGGCGALASEKNADMVRSAGNVPLSTLAFIIGDI